MATNRELLAKRNADIRADYEKMRDRRVNGRRVHKAEYIMQMLSERYYLAIATLENIVYREMDGRPVKATGSGTAAQDQPEAR